MKEVENNSNKIPFDGEITSKMKVSFADSKHIKEAKMDARFGGLTNSNKVSTYSDEVWRLTKGNLSFDKKIKMLYII